MTAPTSLPLCVALWLLCVPAAAQQAQTDVQPAPPPPGTGDVDVLGHVLTDDLGTWRRDGPVARPATPELPGVAASADLLETYRAVCGAAATYRATEGPGAGDVVLVTFARHLDALGFFAARRGPQAQRVTLTSAAYRQDGVLHVHSGRHYLRIEAAGATTEALALDQRLASRLEMRLPQVEELPRALRFFPPRWLEPLSVGYGPTDLLGPDARPMALTVEHEVALSPARIAVIEAESEAQARGYYTMLLERVMATAPACEVLRLGQEAFTAMPDSTHAMAMRQDEFLVWMVGTPTPGDAEAVLRVIGSAIRTSRPLPDAGNRSSADTSR